MPPTTHADHYAVLQRIVDNVGVYPLEAFEFVHRGLAHTVAKEFGNPAVPMSGRHVSGGQLCQGLREFALMQWGLLAGTVLRKWNINNTLDFGKIVFSLVEHDVLAVTEQDTLEDFRNVYDFGAAFDGAYQIPSRPTLTTGRARE